MLRQSSSFVQSFHCFKTEMAQSRCKMVQVCSRTHYIGTSITWNGSWRKMSGHDVPRQFSKKKLDCYDTGTSYDTLNCSTFLPAATTHHSRNGGLPKQSKYDSSCLLSFSNKSPDKTGQEWQGEWQLPCSYCSDTIWKQMDGMKKHKPQHDGIYSTRPPYLQTVLEIQMICEWDPPTGPTDLLLLVLVTWHGLKPLMSIARLASNCQKPWTVTTVGPLACCLV